MKIKFMLAMPLLAVCLGLAACRSVVPVDVVMEGNEVFFVLESRSEISSIRVVPRHPVQDQPALLWELRHDMTTPVKQRKYPRLSQIRYGQNIPEFPVQTGPLELSRDVEYVVVIEIGKKFAQDSFIVTAENKLVMPSPVFKRQRGRVYSAVIDKDGNKVLVGRQPK